MLFYWSKSLNKNYNKQACISNEVYEDNLYKYGIDSMQKIDYSCRKLKPENENWRDNIQRERERERERKRENNCYTLYRGVKNIFLHENSV